MENPSQLSYASSLCRNACRMVRQWACIAFVLSCLGCADRAASSSNTTNASDVTSRAALETPRASSESHLREDTFTTGGSSANRYPTIHMDANNTKQVKVSYKFQFEDKAYSLSMKVSEALLEGARQAEKFAVAKKGEADEDWREKYNLAFIDAQPQNEFLNELHGKFVDIAKAEQLDSDRLAELMTAFVQQIEYDTTENLDAKFPVETFVDKKGDCDDKSRLLVALLMRSGFAVATLNFNEENHMAVGIRSNGMAYRGTEYAYIESTSPSLIGFPFSENADVQLNTTPVPHPIGKGKKKYGASDQVAFIEKTKINLEKDIKKEEQNLDTLTQKCTKAGSEVKALQDQLAATQNGDPRQHNRVVDKYNRAADAYNKLVTEQQRLAKKVNRKIEIRNYIVANATDRYNTYRWVKKKLRDL